MTRGNQREVDRARAAKRTVKRVPKESQSELAKRKERYVLQSSAYTLFFLYV